MFLASTAPQLTLPSTSSVQTMNGETTNFDYAVPLPQEYSEICLASSITDLKP